MTRFQKKIWIVLIAMAMFTPLGIYLPQHFNAGDAWGEWGPDTLRQAIGYVPEGMQKMADLWKAPVPDYNFGGEEAAFGVQTISYVISGLIGIITAASLVYVLMRLLVRQDR